MRIIPVYRDLLLSLTAARQGSPLWPAFHQIAYRPHQSFFDGLLATYGPRLSTPEGLPDLIARQAFSLHAALQPAPAYQMEERAAAILAAVAPHLPGPLPPLYLGTLFFIAPAATIGVDGRPAIVLGLERFAPAPQKTDPRSLYHPDEAALMLPHEAAHAVRMESLSLPPSPQHLTLLDMVMLEGTALLFTDLLLQTNSLATFLSPARLAWHRAHDADVIAAAAAEFGTSGMGAFTRYFHAESPISGYWVGYSLCRRYVDRYGPGAMRELLVLPSAQILARLR